MCYLIQRYDTHSRTDVKISQSGNTVYVITNLQAAQSFTNTCDVARMLLVNWFQLYWIASGSQHINLYLINYDIIALWMLRAKRAWNTWCSGSLAGHTLTQGKRVWPAGLMSGRCEKKRRLDVSLICDMAPSPYAKSCWFVLLVKNALH